MLHFPLNSRWRVLDDFARVFGLMSGLCWGLVRLRLLLNECYMFYFQAAGIFDVPCCSGGIWIEWYVLLLLWRTSVLFHWCWLRYDLCGLLSLLGSILTSLVLYLASWSEMDGGAWLNQNAWQKMADGYSTGVCSDGACTTLQASIPRSSLRVKYAVLIACFMQYLICVACYQCPSACLCWLFNVVWHSALITMRCGRPLSPLEF